MFMPRFNLRTKMYFRKPLGLLLIAGTIAGWGSACGPEQSSKKGDVIINEVACNARDWVEIINVSDSDQDISGWFVADDLYKDRHQYQIPDDTILQTGAKEYLVIKRQEGAEDGFNFGVGCGKDTVYLLDSEQAIVDQVDVGDVGYSNTWGRLPNITGIWRETLATAGKSNEPPLSGL